ncbi:MAG: hypothetical protein AB1650_07335 [Candidatus Omnitrophota bacterium]
MDKRKDPKAKPVKEIKQKSLECEPDDDDCEPFFDTEITEVKEEYHKEYHEHDDYEDLEE